MEEEVNYRNEKLKRNLNKFLYKTLILSLKILPYIIAVGYFLHTMLTAFGVQTIIFGYICHLGVLPWLFLYLASFAFKYCTRHRLPLYYITFNDSFHIIDTYIGIPVSIEGWIVIQLLLICAFIILYIYLKFKT